MGIFDDTFRNFARKMRGPMTAAEAEKLEPRTPPTHPSYEEMQVLRPQFLELRNKYVQWLDPYRTSDRQSAEQAITAMYTSLQLRAPSFLWFPSPLKAVRAAILWNMHVAASKSREPDLSDILNKLSPFDPSATHQRITFGRLHMSSGITNFNAAISRDIDIRGIFASTRGQIDLPLYDCAEETAQDIWLTQLEELQSKIPSISALFERLTSMRAEDREKLFAAAARTEFGLDRARTNTMPAMDRVVPASKFESSPVLVAFATEAMLAWGRFPGPEFVTTPALAEHCTWWRAESELCFVSDGPTRVHRDEVGRLHRFDEPAVEYADGFKIFFLRNIPVSEDVACGKFSADDINEASNVERRRVMIERFGFANYLRETGANEIHRDGCGILYRKEIPGDEPILMVKVKNSTAEPDGTFKEYFLRVPPNMRTAAEAVAWTFEMRPSDYRPALET